MPGSSADSDLESTSLVGPDSAHERTPLLGSSEPRKDSAASLRRESDVQYGIKASDEHDAREAGEGPSEEDVSSKSATGIVGIISVLLLGGFHPRPLGLC